MKGFTILILCGSLIDVLGQGTVNFNTQRLGDVWGETARVREAWGQYATGTEFFA